MSAPIKLLAIMEAGRVTGPAKNLIEFARRARPEIETCIVTFQRSDAHHPSPITHHCRCATGGRKFDSAERSA